MTAAARAVPDRSSDWARTARWCSPGPSPRRGQGVASHRWSARDGVGARRRSARRSSRCTASTRRSGCSSPPCRPRSSIGSQATPHLVALASYREVLRRAARPPRRRSTSCARRLARPGARARPARVPGPRDRGRDARAGRESHAAARRGGAARPRRAAARRWRAEAETALAGDDDGAARRARRGRAGSRTTRARSIQRRRELAAQRARHSRPRSPSSRATSRATASRLAVDPERLQQVRERIGALNGLAAQVRRDRRRRRRVHATRPSARLAELEGADDRLAELDGRRPTAAER